MKFSWMTALFAALLLGVAPVMIGCGEEEADSGTAGDAIEEAAEDAGEAAEDAGEAVEEAAEDAGEAIEDAVE